MEGDLSRTSDAQALALSMIYTIGSTARNASVRGFPLNFQAAIDRSAARSAKRWAAGRATMTRLCAGSFSEVIAGAADGSTLASLLLVDQMLMSIAPNDENAEAFTVVASSPAVNSLR